MSSHNEQVQPTPFDAVQPAAAEAPAAASHSPGGPRSWVLPALGAMLLLVALVIFWLPTRVNGPPAGQAVPTPSEPRPDAAPAGPTAAPTPAKTDTSPWSEAQLAKMRKDAQDVLGELLEIQFALEERGVKQWAPERFAEVAGIAAAGDELYRSRAYVEARDRYQAALTQLQALQDSIPAELARQLQITANAIENGEPAPADAALQLATILEPGNVELAGLEQRIARLPQLLELLDEARAREQAGDLAGAEQLLTRASTLDPRHLHTRQELQRVGAAHQQQRFNDAMSEGYSALDEGRFDAARKSFRAAAELQAGSDEAASALQEVETAATAQRLASLKNSGTRHEQQEQWQQAVAAYEQAIAIDGNVLYAREGLARSTARAALDKQFRTAIEEPDRLSDVAVAEAAEQLLQRARNITSPGPVLIAQVDRLQTLLQQYSTPVAVTLRSDQETEVIVYKVARLGRFAQHELTLRPGTYTAVGSRNGYRDVRQTFTVDYRQPPPPITIACTEPI